MLPLPKSLADDTSAPSGSVDSPPPVADGNVSGPPIEVDDDNVELIADDATTRIPQGSASGPPVQVGVAIDASTPPMSTSPMSSPPVAVSATLDATTIVTPARPPLARLHDDASFQALRAFATAARERLDREHRHWDVLVQVRDFARAARFAVHGAALVDGLPDDAQPLLSRFDDAVERRAIGTLLVSLMPGSMRTARPLFGNGARGDARPVLQALPDELLARAETGFALERDDVPRFAEVFTAHLRGRALLEGVFKVGQPGLFLVSKTHCPGAVPTDRKDLDLRRGGAGDAILVKLGEPCMLDGKRAFEVVVPAQRAYDVDALGKVVEGPALLRAIDHVVGTDGKPVTDGSANKPIRVPLEHLVAWLLSAGAGGGLDLDDVDDRALLVVAAWQMKSRALTSPSGAVRSVFAWLETADASLPRPFLEEIRAAARDACFDAVATSACDPRALAFTLEVHDEDVARVRFAMDEDAAARDAALAEIDWQARALCLLEDTGIARAALERTPSSASSKRKIELAWTQAVFASGFAAGRTAPHAQGDAFARLATTLLAPIGMIPQVGLKEGRGATLLRVLSLPDARGLVDVSIPERVKPHAACHGLSMDRAMGLPRSAEEPAGIEVARPEDDGKKAPIHDLAALQDRVVDIADALEDSDATRL